MSQVDFVFNKLYQFFLNLNQLRKQEILNYNVQIKKSFIRIDKGFFL